MMRNKAVSITLLFFCFINGAAVGIPAKIRFSGLDISNDGKALFRVDSANGIHEESALFVSQLVDLSLKQLTAFPRNIDLLENGRMILVRNSFGWTRIPVAGGVPALFTEHPSFIERSNVSLSALKNAEVSKDGKWLVLLESVSAAYGNLALVNISSGAKTLVASHVEKSDRAFPVRWSPDSQSFIYERDRKLYYYQVAAPSHIEEQYRLIGEGSIACVVWETEGDFFYINGSTVRRIKGSEIFFRSMYRDFLEIGVQSGTLPFAFDPDFDEFYTAPDANALLISKANRTNRALFFYPLGAYRGTALPYLQLPELCSGVTTLWSSANIITIIAHNGTGQSVYRLNAAAESAFIPLASPGGMDNAALSPDGGRVILWGEKGAVLYDYSAWRRIQSISDAPVYDCVWLGDDFIIGDEKRIERIHINQDNSATRHLICLSSIDSVAFEAETNRILAQNNGKWFVTDGRRAWTELQDPVMRPTSLVSGRYRVYLEKQESGIYENLPMIRNITSVGTTPLIRIRDSSVFQGGAIALCFDVYDDATGLSHVLDALDFFNIKATFFLNGEGIRRYPEAARRIADAGHETASLFFAPLDLSTSRYIIDNNFIVRSLARNEDEFFAATGKELALLWHPPFYVASSKLREFALSAGYKTASRDVDPGDAVTMSEALRLGLPFRSASAMIENIMEKKRNASVIPVRLGLLEGGRDTYLYNRIFVLLDALINAGYSVVPVSKVAQ
ncbi:MAG: polysaccharide deacetylase family protein [Treponema sp.]|jgi:WD40 repeat protein|nr:polysaccharide deacetylase family protein [Treponema sp.]